MHKLLERQLKKHFGSLEAVPADLAPVLDQIDRSYTEADADRRLVERSLELTSGELLERNSALTAELENRTYTESLRSAILDSALDCIILMDQQGIVREFNPAAQRTFGFTREQAVGKRLAELIIPEKYRAAHSAGLQKYLATGDGPVLHKRIEIVGLRADGSEIPVELAIIPFKAAGQAMFAGYLRDLSDRMRAQEEIRRRTATVQLLQQVPLLANEADSMDEAARLCLEKVCEYTGWPVGHAYFVNEADTEMTSHGVWRLPPGLEFEAFRTVTEATTLGPGIGLPGRVWESRKPAWIPDVMKDNNFPRATRAQAIGVHSAFGIPVLVGHRVLVVLEFFSDHIREPDEELLTVMANVGEQLGRVLERRRAEAELKAAYQQLQEVDRARIQFINTAAHELGTPLTPIKLQVEMVKNRLDAHAEPQQRKSVEILERNVSRLSHLVKDLLDSARLQTGQLQVVPQTLDIHQEAERAVEAYRQPAAAAGVRLTLAPGRPMAILADVRRIGQVLDNLLSNAVKFTPHGGAVRVDVERTGSFARVSVRDGGIGLRPDAIAKLFQPFSQVHDTMQITQPGTGLGLYISKGIVEALGGDVGCTSPGLGKGSTFWFTLRLADQTAAANPK
ncbi:MAG: ATP-binding protein [bacterium]